MHHFNTLPANESFTSNALMMGKGKSSLQIEQKQLDATDGFFRIQVSNDNKVWINQGEPITLNQATGSSMTIIEELPVLWMRYIYDSGSNTTGTINISIVIQ